MSSAFSNVSEYLSRLDDHHFAVMEIGLVWAILTQPSIVPELKVQVIVVLLVLISMSDMDVWNPSAHESLSH